MEGKRIVLCASRKLEEMKALIEKQGGIPLVRSAQGTVFSKEDELGEEIRTVIAMRPDWMIFTTGVGVETLIESAEREGVKEEWLETIGQANVAVRGYKTVAALKKIGISPVAASDDGTTKGLIRSLQPFSFTGKNVVVQLHGDTAPTLKQFLYENGAVYTELLPYRHVAPDSDVLEQLSEEIIDHKVDAVCFTAAMQVRFLFSFVKEQKDIDKFRRAFAERVVACAVGKVTAEALHEEGVARVVSPELERMGAMIVELSRYFKGK
ncbi:uroporphyrinogen-III synthase [Thermaerobacillus caldiproteolyticus]|uniref:Uroporphyrinogen-III synthase n=1 Tax=Thermaerobacillus caldiproteolyticus TaxID=247480 RepID=A0A7W0C0U9_9BACL|nr:uroporphyrinogen-III synthase [Anoxybacillus caldiproteolyticus]MBA2875934.1 uroporphyrinogen-III synthase [Anoxybacillus caldiproteolyticus]QPA32424.1 uroporphyrinogen-III synthase [Anoxybacillus caldiproteolyticus]